MKKLVYFLLIIIISTSCEMNDSLSSAERNVISENGSISFEELLILVNVKTSDNSYLVVNSLNSVNLYINNFYWSKINSQTIDTSKIEKLTVGNKYLTDKKINYLIIANQDIRQPEYNTAGEYAKYLNAAYTLKPGEYVCLIESFQVTFNDNTTKTYYPYKYVTFKVEQNSRSVFVGEIELTID